MELLHPLVLCLILALAASLGVNIHLWMAKRRQRSRKPTKVILAKVTKVIDGEGIILPEDFVSILGLTVGQPVHLYRYATLRPGYQEHAGTSPMLVAFSQGEVILSQRAANALNLSRKNLCDVGSWIEISAEEPNLT